MARGSQVWKFVIFVLLLLPEFGPFLSGEVVKETDFFLLTFLDFFLESQAFFIHNRVLKYERLYHLLFGDVD